ncbi:MAG: ferritin-like domain-containing protein [Chloroflexi bacterium]|nr:ferritin-like domain-containing protein [Chloroflexota bacterium]
MNEKLIALLNEDIEGEHAAIVQYLEHAYGVGEGDIACEIEAIAREEMRHMDWLAETVVRLGGAPSLARGPMRQGNGWVADWLKNDVLAEQEAIALYAAHIAAIEDREIRRLLQRIHSDEVAHQDKFESLVVKAQRQGARDRRGERKDRLAAVLNWGIEHEYTVILQYLFHSYMTGNADIKRELEDQAVNEMQHMGWLAEKLVDKSGTPRMEHAEIDRSPDAARMLRADIAVEREVTEEYARQIEEVKDADVKKLLARVKEHEIYHDEVFADLLQKADN